MPIKNYQRYGYAKEPLRDLHEFCQRYRAQAKTGRPVRRTEPISFKQWTKDTDFQDLYINTFDVETIDLNLTQEDFKQLLDDLSELDSEDYNEYVRLRKHLGEHFILEFIDQKGKQTREQRIRYDNPGVQKAWENYQLMLKLAGG